MGVCADAMPRYITHRPAPRGLIRAPNDEQQAAITAPVDAAVRVLAGPGAGKTFVIAQRYAFLLSQGARPAHILAVTYSRDMAAELLRRITAAAPAAARDPEARRQVCTIHAACYRMLREAGDTRELAKTWQVRQALKALAKNLWPDERRRPGWALVDEWLRASKAAGLGDEAALARYFAQSLGPADGPRMAEARRRFDLALREQGLLTFDDMLLDVERRLQTDAAFRQRWQTRYRWVIVDEGQDTSAQAMRILGALAAPEDRLFVVGDPDQTLFRFAGAAPEHNLYDGFERRFPRALTFKLNVNYRSTRAIVDAQLRLIRHNYAGQGGPYADRYRKDLRPRPEAPAGEPVTFRWYATPDDEARGVAAEIGRLLKAGHGPDDFFVGARTRAQLAFLEGALAEAALPYVNVAGGSFWALSHVQDVVAYVALAHDRNDREAFARVYNLPSRHIEGRWLGKEFLNACGGAWAGLDAAAARNPRWAPGVDDLRSLVALIERALKKAGPASAVHAVLDECYDAYLQQEALDVDVSGDAAADDRLAELDVVARVAGRFTRPADFVAYARRMAARARDTDPAGRIVLATLHRLKGQERRVVFGVGWSEDLERARRPAGLLPHHASLGDGDAAALADERCAAFVLISRAQERCLLSGVAEYRDQALRPSRFVAEAGVDNGLRKRTNR